MELKRILARDARTATEQAIRLYGEDVLIVSNHKVGHQTELVLAVDLTAPATPAPAALPGPQETGFRQQLDGLLAWRPGAPTGQDTAAEPAAAAAPAAHNDRDRIRSQEIVAMVREELADLRREIRLVERRRQSATPECSPALQPLVQQLQQAAMPEALRSLLLDGLQGLDDEDQARHTLRAQLLAAIDSASASAPAAGVHALLGPSGAGKTTLAARLARSGAAQWGEDAVALIGWQDQRAGAWSQLQMLAAQAGVPVYRAPDAERLALLLAELSHCRMLVIDTPGVEIEQHVPQLMAQCPEVQLHAVLPVDASQASCRRLLAQPDWPVHSLMLTKFDEADAPWPLIQCLSNRVQAVQRSLIGQGPHIGAPVRHWTVQELVDHALHVSGLAPSGEAPGPWPVAAPQPLSATWNG